MLNYVKERLFEVVILIIVAIIMWATFAYPWAYSFAQDPAGPALLPRISAALLIIFTIINLIVERNNKYIDLDYFPLKSKEGLFYVLFLLSTVVLVYGIWNIGIFVSCFVYLLIWLYIFKISAKKVVIYALCGSIALFLLFNLSGLFIPDGILF